MTKMKLPQIKVISLPLKLSNDIDDFLSGVNSQEELQDKVNRWIQQHAHKVSVTDIRFYGAGEYATIHYDLEFSIQSSGSA
ncbi:hypothetical protein B8V81_5081 [Paenibacillus pasadenensis]|uniref:Uncharacterized protein n=1 Tax=Paenibacillus pasadenensis TaxID=217090 RepID=A0A2N5MZN0_9BACL|nr:hypothetical protein [Paenibacillus pasadenensis]PLT43541.1 hypothetical protein B8V81_5081 [Paenibacillus pasadenensis]